MRNALSYKSFVALRQASTWVILGAAFLYAVATGVSFAVLLGNTDFAVSYRELMMQSSSALPTFGYGMNFSELMEIVQTEVSVQSFADFFDQCLYGRDIAIYLALFILFNMNRERRAGLQVSFGSAISRKEDFFANWMMVFVYSVALIAVMFLGFGLMYLVGFSGLPFDLSGAFPLSALLKVLVLTTFGLTVLVTLELLSGARSAMFLSILYVLFLSEILYSLLDSLFQSMKLGFIAEFFLPLGAFSVIRSNDPATFIVGVAASAIFSAGMVLLEFYVVPKRDRA